MGVDMSRRGPLVEGRGPEIIRQAEDEIERDVAQYAETQVKARLSTVLKHPTGYYMSHVRSYRSGSLWQVDDSRVVYGPWLETGKHRRRTRFKGYLTFRKVSQLVSRRAGGIAERVVSRHIRRLG